MRHRSQRQQLQAQHHPIVLEVHMVHHEQPRAEQHQQYRQTAGRHIAPATAAAEFTGGLPDDARHEQGVARHDGAPQEEHGGGGVVRRCGQAQHAGVRERRQQREPALKPREQRRVVQRPLARAAGSLRQALGRDLSLTHLGDLGAHC